MIQATSSKKGHPILHETLHVSQLSQNNPSSTSSKLEELYQADLSLLIVKEAFSPAYVKVATHNLTSSLTQSWWLSPNKGMQGGELRTIGHAATPTFTAFGGPKIEDYLSSIHHHPQRSSLIFETESSSFDPTQHLISLFEALGSGKANPPSFNQDSTWLPFNYRALDPSVQIYSHHDQHYRLPIYSHLDDTYDRSAILSWFITLQPAQEGGELILYGLWGDDPNPPMLPTRFLDTNVLENEYLKYTPNLEIGDLVIFNSSCHVHRVSPVQKNRPRYTLGGFLTLSHDRSKIAFWS